MKHCIDCKWMKQVTWWGWLGGYVLRNARCLNPATLSGSKKTDALIAPTVNPKPAFCSVARGDYGKTTTCGPEGRLWEAKEV